MFENNADFDLDDEIFGTPFGGSSTPSSAIKRANEHKTDIVIDDPIPKKKFCPRKLSQSSPPAPQTSTPPLRPQTITPPSQCASFLSKLKGSSCPNHNTFKLPTKRVLSRKFPGPAGLLPEPSTSDSKLEEVKERNTIKHATSTNTETEIVCSQMSIQVFTEGPWLQMTKDFRSDCPHQLFLPDKYNVAWIKSRAKANMLINQKAPFLAAVIQNIECLNLKTALVTVALKDSSGEIQGTVVHDLFEQYKDMLTVGSVVILKQVGVLTMEGGTKQYLTITANNLVTIYNRENNFNVKTVRIQRFITEDFERNINDVKKKHREALMEKELNSEDVFEDVLLKLREDRANKSASVTITGEALTRNVNAFPLPRCKISTAHENHSVILPKTNTENCISSSNTSKFKFKSYKKCNEAETLTLSVINDKKFDVTRQNLQDNSIKNNNEIKFVSVNNLDDKAIVENVLDGIDTDSLFEDDF